MSDGANVKLSPCDQGKILLVDDEEMIVQMFSMILSDDLPDKDISTAGNGIQALEEFSTGHHAVLVMDLHMPVMDGYTAFREIKKMCETRKWQMPVVLFVTGFAPPEALSQIFVDSPEHAVLSKPISGDDLVKAVRSRLEGQA